MATYQEIRALINDSDLQEKLEVAISVSADAFMRAATPTADEVVWADKVLNGPKVEANKALISILAANASLTVAQILGATDESIQSQTDEIVPRLVEALASVSTAAVP